MWLPSPLQGGSRSWGVNETKTPNTKDKALQMAPQPESPSLLHMISVLQCALACCLYQILNMLRKYRHVQAQWISFPVWCIGMWTIQTVQEDPAAQELKKASVASCKCHNSPFEPDLPNWFAKLSCLCLPLPVYMALHLHLWTEDDKCLCRLDSFQHFLNMAWWSGEGLTLYGLYISFYAILVPLFPSTSVPEFLAKICQKSSRPCLQSQMLRTRTLTVFPQHGNPILSALFECVQCALSQSAFCSAFIPENLLMGMRGITWCACWLVNESCCHEVAATFRQWLKEKKKFEDSGAFDQQWPAFSGRMRSHRTQLFHIFHTVRMMTLRIRWRFWQMDPALTLDRSVTVVTGSPRPIWQGWKNHWMQWPRCWLESLSLESTHWVT